MSFLLPDNGSKNSILNRVLKLNLVQQKVFHPNTLNNVSFYWLIKHWILHIACISPALSLKMFFLKFRDYFVILGSALEPLEVLQRLLDPQLRLFLLNSIYLKNDSSFFSETNLDMWVSTEAHKQERKLRGLRCFQTSRCRYHLLIATLFLIHNLQK